MSTAPLLHAKRCTRGPVEGEGGHGGSLQVHTHARVTVQPMENVAIPHRQTVPRTSPSRHRPPPAPPAGPTGSPPAPARPTGSTPIITLDTKRDGPRAGNLYVDTPHNVPTNTSSPSAVITSQPTSVSSPITSSIEQPCTQQPVSKTEKDPNLSLDTIDENAVHTESIICSKCKKCRCQACTQPRPIVKVFCNKKCECSPIKCVDYCSCLFCIQCIFYHCFKDNEGDDEVCSADDPCACCERPHCCKRWTCMGVMSLCLPCLCLYWPLRGCVASFTMCYNKCSRKGCHCRKEKVQNITKRLLIPDSESSST